MVTLAEIRVAASSRNILEGCEFVGPLNMRGNVVKQQLQIKGGKVKVSHDRGLGSEIDEEELSKWIQP